MDQVVVGTFSPSVLLDVARSTARLAAQGLSVQEVPVSSSPGQFRSLLDGELTVGLTSPDNVLAYRYDPRNPLGTTLDARMVAAIDRGLGLGLYGRAGATAADLRDATVGVDVPTSGFALALYALAESLGVARQEYEVVALGSTPRRLEALLEGRCAFTMLNAGNELVAEHHGCVRLASVADRLSPYLGTVLAVVGEAHTTVASRLAGVLTSTAADLVAGGLRGEAVAAAAARLGLDAALAERYVDRLRDPREGLVPDGVVDRGALQTLIGLRSSYLPGLDGAPDVLAPALHDPGLVE